MDCKPTYTPWEAATDAITDILHAYCEPGDELTAEELLRRTENHFLAESDTRGEGLT